MPGVEDCCTGQKQFRFANARKGKEGEGEIIPPANIEAQPLQARQAAAQAAAAELKVATFVLLGPADSVCTK